ALSLEQQEIRAGSSLRVTGEGFEPESTVILELRSDPVMLAEATIDGEGRFSATVTIPEETGVGSHTLVVVGGAGAVVSAALTVLAADDPGGDDGTGGGDDGGSDSGDPDGGGSDDGSDEGDGAGESGGLATTGADSALPLGLAILSVL